MVGNNTPVFFVRDPLKFQNFIRSQKRLAANNLRDADMQWDFWTLSPESSHQVTWLMGDRGIPRNWRHMNGYSSHTYMWVNDAGERFWVKYHFKADQGVEFLTQAEADRIAGEDADYHQRDLYEAIERREFPSWSLKMQIMPFDEAKTYRFNPFDLTKVWPHGDYPLLDVGRLTLDRNVTDYHTEIEQAAFQPNNTVPGTGLSPDKMLLARGFSYADAHRARLGVNYQQIPVNRPKAPVRSYSKDGAMRMDNVADPVYYPNSFDGAPAADEVTLCRGCRLGGQRRDGTRRVHAARRGRRLRPGQHPRQRGAGRRRPRSARRQRLGPPGRPPAPRGAPARLRVLAQHRQDRRRPHRRRHRAQTDPLNPTTAGRRAPQALPRVCCAITEAEIAAGKPA